MSNVLNIENVCYSHGNKKVLDHISFTCENGIIALLGKNGAGKSTLMNILVGLKQPSKGKVSLNTINLMEKETYPLNKVGYLPQDFDIYSNITGYDFLSYVYDVKNIQHPSKQEAIADIVKRLDLESVIKKKFKTYSGGFKRRLGIAQAIIGEPELLIIDEPSVGLDPEQRMQFRSFLSEISKNAVTLISTHIIEDVELYSDCILILKDQTIQFQGTVNELIEASRPYLFEMEINRAELAKFKQRVSVIEERRIGNDFIKVKFIKNDYEVGECYPAKEISLENAYVYFQQV